MTFLCSASSISATLLMYLALSTCCGQVVPKVVVTDSTNNKPSARPRKFTFIAGSDQRFTFLRDTRTPDGKPIQVNLWGARAGMLFPSRIKVGVGYYFTYQSLNDSEKYWSDYKLQNRNIHFAMMYVEKYWIRREYWEFSTPAEIGVGFSRYSLQNQRTGEEESRVANSIPLGVGTIFAVKFPPLGPIRVVRWFGLSLLTGYRISLKHDFPSSPVNYNGFYYSVGPAFFFDRFTEDLSRWRRKQKAKRASRVNNDL